MNESTLDDSILPMKVVLVGDGSVGKTSLLVSYTSNHFPDEYTPTIFDNYVATIKCRSQIVKMGLWDTAGQEEYHRLRALAFPQTDVFLVCFSMIDPKSFNHALNKWLPQVHDSCPHALKIFVGTKSDSYKAEQNLVNVRRRPLILPYEIMQSKVEATGHEMMTCSALSGEGVNEVFTAAIKRISVRKQMLKTMKKIEEEKCQLI